MVLIQYINKTIQGQDSWAGKGSGGHKDVRKAPKVIPLDSVPCQHASHGCEGVYICQHLDMSLLDGCERYSAEDTTDARKLWEAERALNEHEIPTLAGNVARCVSDSIFIFIINNMLRFWKEIHSTPCKHSDRNGNMCKGVPVIRKMMRAGQAVSIYICLHVLAVI